MHQCLLYASDQERRSIVTRHIHEGLLQGEKVLALQDAAMERQVLHDLQRRGIRVNHLLQRGQLVMFTLSPHRVDDALFHPEDAVHRLRKESTQALRDGYQGLRVTGDMAWALNLSATMILTYEAKINRAFPPHCRGLCQYDQRLFPSPLLLDLAALHPSIMQGSQIIQNTSASLMTDLTLSLASMEGSEDAS